MRGQPTPPNVEKRKPNTISAAIDDDLFDFSEDFRWKHRMTKTDVVVEAMTEWATKRGFSASPNVVSIPDHVASGES